MNISDVVNRQKLRFKSGPSRDPDFRIHQLNQLKELITRHDKELCDAMHSDFGKPVFEAYTAEIITVKQELDVHIKNIRSWMKPETVRNSILTFPAKNQIYMQPFGTTLIIGAWNYPIYLTLMPLIGALSAGNSVVLKPSELSPQTSSILRKLIGNYFDADWVTVIEGAVEETQTLLKQPFDKIFFTGSTRVGKIVMKAAAEQLIPVTLELGGKSPAIIHHDVKMDVSSRRIWWGKCINAGQTCVAPDYVAVHESMKESFIEQSRKTLQSFFENDYITGQNYTQIVNQSHFDRLCDLLKKSSIISGGEINPETRFIEPTLIEANWDSPIMQEEIFGPLLPVITYKKEDTLIDHLQDLPSPLALYLFTESDSFQKKIIESVPFGGGSINDTVSHLTNPNLPFGGVGASGMGSYHGVHSFNTFSRKQSILKKPLWPDPDFRYPPYTDSKLGWIKRLLT